MLLCNEDRERMLDKFIVTIASRMEEAWEQDKENDQNNVTEMLDDEINNINNVVANISPEKGTSNKFFDNDDEINEREALGEIDCN